MSEVAEQKSASPKELMLFSLAEKSGYENPLKVKFISKKLAGFTSGWYLFDTENEQHFLGTRFTDAQAMLMRKAQESGNIQVNYNFEAVLDLEGFDEQEPVELSEEQAAVMNAVIAAIEAKQTVVLTIKGYAGTGKTTILQQIHKFLPEARVMYTAPTNKAVKVLQQKMPDQECATIQSTLCLKLKKEKGEQFLVPNGTPILEDYDAIVIDEASMLGEQLVETAERYIIDNPRVHAALIYVGDPKQMPPVGERDSLAFDVENVVELENIVRQAEDNPILKNTKILRRMPNWDLKRLILSQDMDAEIGAIKVRASEFRPFVRQMFKSEEFASDHDYVRYLCWTNDKVKEVNYAIHAALYGKSDCPWALGERIMTREPVADGSIRNSEECIIQSIEPTDNWVGFPAWKMVVLSESNVVAEVHVLHDSAELEFETKKEMLIENKAWPEFYEMTESFASIQHAYAMTVHKSQGSTFDNVIIDLPDILRNHDNPKELMSLMYVAFSRPRYRAFLRA